MVNKEQTQEPSIVADPGLDPMSALRQTTQQAQSVTNGTVSTPAIEETKGAIASNQQAQAALPPMKYSRDGIPEGLDHVTEMERLRAMIQGNTASANDIDNYITLQVRAATQFQREGEAAAVDNILGGADGAGADATGATARETAGKVQPAQGARAAVRAHPSGGAGGQSHSVRMGGGSPPSAPARGDSGERGGVGAPKQTVDSPAPKKPAVDMSYMSDDESGITTGPQRPQSPPPARSREASRAAATAKVSARELNKLSPEERAKFTQAGLNPLNEEGWDQAKYNGPFKSAEEMRDRLGAREGVERAGTVGSPEFMASVVPPLLGAAGMYGAAKMSPSLGRRAGAALETGKAMLNKPAKPPVVNNNISRVAKPPGLQLEGGQVEANLPSSSFASAAPNVRPGRVGGMAPDAKAAQLRAGEKPTARDVRQTVRNAESSETAMRGSFGFRDGGARAMASQTPVGAGTRPRNPGKTATQLASEASEYLERRDNPAARTANYTSQKTGPLKAVQPAPKRTEGYSVNTQTDAAVKRNSMNKSQRAADANKKAAAESKTAKAAPKKPAAPKKTEAKKPTKPKK